MSDGAASGVYSALRPEAVNYLKNEFDMPSNMLLPLFKDMEKRNIKLRAGHYLAALEHVGGAESSDIRQLLDQMAALRSDPRLPSCFFFARSCAFPEISRVPPV